MGEHQVVVSIEDDRRAGMVGTKSPHQIEDAGAGHAGSERALGGKLIGQAIGERIGKRNAQFKQIDAVREDGAAGGERRVEIRSPAQR